jgi:hypothetical protein
MEHVTTGRRLVKSSPELWAELSDPESLARRLGELGEIRITRTLPETAVAWEAERATGIVEIEPSGWGTRVSLSASPTAAPEPEPPPAPPPPALLPPPATIETKVRIVGEEERRIEIPVAPPEPVEPLEPPAPARPLAVEAEPASRSRRFGRLLRRRPAEPLAEPEPPLAPEPEPEPRPPEPPPPPDVVTLRVVHAVCATRVPERPAPPPAPPPPAPVPDPDALQGDDLRAVLDRVLDDLGAAHHRPFSRG